VVIDRTDKEWLKPKVESNWKYDFVGKFPSADSKCV